MKRALLIFCACVLLVLLPGTALADSESAVEADSSYGVLYTYIDYAAQTLNITVSGRADMGAELQCTASIDKTRISAYLQKYTNGSWDTVNHWSKTEYSDECSWSQSYYVVSGSYRLYTYYYAYIDDVVVESTTLVSYDTY